MGRSSAMGFAPLPKQFIFVPGWIRWEARVDRQQFHNAALSKVAMTEAATRAIHSDLSTSAMTRDDSLDPKLVE